MASLVKQTDRLVLSPLELKQLTDWDDKVIEDYINILRDYIRLANSVDENTDTDNDLAGQIGLSPVASSIPRQTIRRLNSEVAVVGTATITNIQTDSAIVNTNTPAEATSYALELKDESGVSLGFIPVYGSQW